LAKNPAEPEQLSGLPAGLNKAPAGCAPLGRLITSHKNRSVKTEYS